MLSVNNSQSALLAANNLRKAALDERTALSRLSTGKASAFPGDRVTEESMSTGLRVQRDLMQVASNTTSQAKEVLNVGYAAADQMLDMVIRQISIAAQSVSDNITDRERVINDNEFQNLRGHYDLTAEQATYNGVTLLTGLYTGDSFIETQKAGGERVYDITRVDQYSAHGVLGDNALLAKNSSVQITDKIGKDAASGTMSFSQNLKDGDIVDINGKNFTAVDSSLRPGLPGADEFKIGADLEATLKALVEKLTASSFEEVAPSSYYYSVVQGAGPNPPITEGTLHIQHNASGSVGNDFAIGVNIAPPMDTPTAGSTPARGSIEFVKGFNLFDGFNVNVNGVTFTATTSPSATMPGAFLLGANLAETITNLAAKLNTSGNSSVSAANYAVNSNQTGIDITYKKIGSEGNKFEVGVDNTITGTQYVAIKDVMTATTFNTAKVVDSGTGAPVAGQSITIHHGGNSVIFTSVAAATGVETDFVAGAATADGVKAFADAFNKYVENHQSDFGGLGATATTGILQLYDQSGVKDSSTWISFSKLFSGTAGTADLVNGAAFAANTKYGITVPPIALTAPPPTMATRAVGAVTFTSAINKNVSAGDKFTITNGTKTGTFTFGATAGNEDNGVVQVGGVLGTPAATDALASMRNLANAINIRSYDLGVHASATGTTLSLTAMNYGIAGNAITFQYDAAVGSTFELTVDASAAAAGSKAQTAISAFATASTVQAAAGDVPIFVNTAIADGNMLGNTESVNLSGGASASYGQRATAVVRVYEDGALALGATDKLTIGATDYTVGAVALPADILNDRSISATKKSFMVLQNVVEATANRNIDLFLGASGVDAANGKYFDMYIQARESTLPVNVGNENAANNTLTVTLTAAAAINGAVATGAAPAALTTLLAAATTFTTIAGTTNVLPGSHIGVNRQLIQNTNKISINGGGEGIPDAGELNGTLLGGSDRLSGTYAKAQIDFNTSVANAVNFHAYDKINLNGVDFVFLTATTPPATPPQGNILIGANLDETLSNLAFTLNNTVSDAGKALFQYDKDTHKLTLTYKTEGAEGNEYNFNFGGTAVLYDIGDGAVTSSKTVNIGDIARRSIAGSVLGIVPGQPAFSQNLKGEVSGLQAIFQAGQVSTTSPNAFTSNSVQFMALLDGTRYESDFIALARGGAMNGGGSGSGYAGLGDLIAGGTDITFHKVGSSNNEIGFSLKVGDAGFALQRIGTIADVQAELNAMTNTVNDAIKVSVLKIGITAPQKMITTYGLKSIDQFQSNGVTVDGSHLLGNVEIRNTSGLQTAQGTLEFDSNAFQNGDYVMVNGTKVLFQQDVNLGTDLMATMRSMARCLNLSSDENIAKATYKVDDNAKLIVTYKQPGVDGNNFTLQAEMSGIVGGAKAKINANTSFSSSTATTALGALELGVVDPAVIKGTNRIFPDNPLPMDLLGAFTQFDANFVEGVSGGSTDDITPNAVLFTAIVNNTVYSGNVILSGGSKTAGVVDGTSYNGLGGIIAGGTEIVLDSTDKQSSIVLTVDRLGIDINGIDKSDVVRKLGDALSSMTTGTDQMLIGQRRILSGLNIESLPGSLLRGLKPDNISFLSAEFDDTGQAGLVSKFHFDRDTSVLSVKIGESTYSQTLSNPASQNGLGDKYDSVNHIITGGVYTDLIMKREDGFGALQINLGGVADIDLSTDEGASYLEASLNQLFNASESSGLTFQIGVRSTDLLVLNFPDLRSKSMYRDENGEYINLDVKTKATAKNTVQVLENVITALRQARSTMGSSYSQFDAILSVLNASMRATESAISVLSDADMPVVTMDHTLSLIRSNAAASGLVHTLSSLKDIMNRLLQI